MTDQRMIDDRDALIGVLLEKCELLEEWRETLRSGVLRRDELLARQEAELRHVWGVLLRLADRQFGSVHELSAELLPPHPEKLVGDDDELRELLELYEGDDVPSDAPIDYNTNRRSLEPSEPDSDVAVTIGADSPRVTGSSSGSKEKERPDLGSALDSGPNRSNRQWAVSHRFSFGKASRFILRRAPKRNSQ